MLPRVGQALGRAVVVRPLLKFSFTHVSRKVGIHSRASPLAYFVLLERVSESGLKERAFVEQSRDHVRQLSAHVLLSLVLAHFDPCPTLYNLAGPHQVSATNMKVIGTLSIPFLCITY